MNNTTNPTTATANRDHTALIDVSNGYIGRTITRYHLTNLTTGERRDAEDIIKALTLVGMYR